MHEEEERYVNIKPELYLFGNCDFNKKNILVDLGTALIVQSDVRNRLSTRVRGFYGYAILIQLSFPSDFGEVFQPHSCSAPLMCGIPQGSIIGPILLPLCFPMAQYLKDGVFF